MKPTDKDIHETVRDTVRKLSVFDEYKGLMHQDADDRPLPSQDRLMEIIQLGRCLLFPGYFGVDNIHAGNIEYHVGVLAERLLHVLSRQIRSAFWAENMDSEAEQADDLAARFISRMPYIRQMLSSDVESAYRGDPAATSFTEIIVCYPVIRALANYRMAHELLLLGIPLLPRMLTEMAHSETGIDIHPGAAIADHFTIDHGTGVVIGATCIIGSNVKLYQGVTLGAKSFPLDENGDPVKGIARHPIIGDNVIIYSNATVLGRITIGHDSVIGGNVWVTEDVEPGSHIVQYRKNKSK